MSQPKQMVCRGVGDRGGGHSEAITVLSRMSHTDDILTAEENL